MQGRSRRNFGLKRIRDREDNACCAERRYGAFTTACGRGERKVMVGIRSGIDGVGSPGERKAGKNNRWPRRSNPTGKPSREPSPTDRSRTLQGGHSATGPGERPPVGQRRTDSGGEYDTSSKVSTGENHNHPRHLPHPSHFVKMTESSWSTQSGPLKEPRL